MTFISGFILLRSKGFLPIGGYQLSVHTLSELLTCAFTKPFYMEKKSTKGFHMPLRIQLWGIQKMSSIPICTIGESLFAAMPYNVIRPL